jgi:hypothetical protein
VNKLVLLSIGRYSPYYVIIFIKTIIIVTRLGNGSEDNLEKLKDAGVCEGIDFISYFTSLTFKL